MLPGRPCMPCLRRCQAGQRHELHLVEIILDYQIFTSNYEVSLRRFRELVEQISRDIHAGVVPVAHPKRSDGVEDGVAHSGPDSS